MAQQLNFIIIPTFDNTICIGDAMLLNTAAISGLDDALLSLSVELSAIDVDKVAYTEQTKTNAEKEQALNNLGIPSYANIAAANAALNIGDLFYDQNDNKTKVATA